MAPTRSRRRHTNAVVTQGGQGNEGQAGPSRVNLNLQAMRTEWYGIRGIENLQWVLSTWLSQPSSISSSEQLELVEVEWKKCFHNGPNSSDNSYTSDPSLDYQLEWRTPPYLTSFKFAFPFLICK
jgi:hypothetical protein